MQLYLVTATVADNEFDLLVKALNPVNAVRYWKRHHTDMINPPTEFTVYEVPGNNVLGPMPVEAMTRHDVVLV